jgi:hypothetical protein
LSGFGTNIRKLNARRRAPMWLMTPNEIAQVLVERQLEPVSDNALDQSVRDWQSRGDKLTVGKVLRDMPVISIGQPETWRLRDLYTISQLPRPIRAKLNHADFYLVRLSCSFRPLHEENRVEWARFRAALLPHSSTGAQPTAFDVYPQQVVQEVKRQIKVTLSPLLKFQELEASLGSAEFGFEYTELIPLVSGTVGASFDPSWDYRAVRGQDVQGTKWMYLLVKAPRGMIGGRALLDLEADVLVRNARVPVTLWRKQEQEPNQLIVTLWS